MNNEQTLKEQHAELKERWKMISTEIDKIGYHEKDAAAAELAMWAIAKSVQFGIIFEQPITKETNQRLDELLKQTHGIMFFDAIALGGKDK